jgi:hypothetical protein
LCALASALRLQPFGSAGAASLGAVLLVLALEEVL